MLYLLRTCPWLLRRPVCERWLWSGCSLSADRGQRQTAVSPQIMQSSLLLIPSDEPATDKGKMTKHPVHRLKLMSTCTEKKDQITSSQSLRAYFGPLTVDWWYYHILLFYNFSLSSTGSFGLHHDVQKETSFLFWHNDHTNSACICAVRHQDNKRTFLCRHLVVKYMRATCYSSNWWHSSFFKKSSLVCVLNCCFYHLLKNVKFKFRRRNWLDYSAVRRICWLLLPWHQTVALESEAMQETNVSDFHSLIVRCYSHIQAIYVFN